MKRSVLLDTGPLVAMLDQRDQHHEWANQQFDRCKDPMATCEAVIAEACHLVRELPDGPEAVIHLLRRSVISISFQLEHERDRVAELLRQYTDLPIDLADACLIRMTERIDDCVVLTLDSDFRIYRRAGRSRIPLLMPNDS